MKLAARVILIVVILLTLIGFILNFVLENRIDELLRSRINNQLGEEFEFDFRKSNLSLFENDFRIYNVVVSRSDSDSLKWQFEVEELKLTGFKALSFLQDGSISTDSIHINQPALNVYKLDLKPKSERKLSINDTAEDINFKIKHIRISEASVLLDPPGPELLKSGLEVDIKGVNFQGNILDVADRLASLEVHLPNITYVTPDSVYTLTAQALNISFTDSLVRVDSLKVKNNIGLTEFSRFMTWRKGLFDIEVPEMQMSLPRPYQDSGWTVSHLSLNNPVIKIMKDMRFPLPDRKTELPQEQLRSLGLKFKVDSLNLNDAQLELITRVSGSSTSDLVITDIKGVLYSLQNFNYSEPAYQLYADGKLMGKADLHANITYLYGELNPFHLNGKVEDIKLEFLDHYLRRQVGVAIASGKLDGIKFDMKGNHNGIFGEVEFLYHDLRIHIVDKDTDEDKVFLNILSDSAGDLFFYRENPHKNKLRLGRFNVERDVRKGFISQWVDGMMQGIVNSITKKEVDLKLSQEKNSKQKKKHHSR